MDGPPAICRRRRATKGVPLVPLPRASRRKDSSPLGYGYISSGRPKRKYDGFFPVLSSEVTSANRKKRKLIHDRWLGRIPDAPFTSPLEPGWVGFTDKEVEILKAGYVGRSFYGGPDYRCPRCKASFWFLERVKSLSKLKNSQLDMRVVYHLCCKGGKVFIEPFKKLLNFLLTS